MKLSRIFNCEIREPRERKFTFAGSVAFVVFLVTAAGLAQQIPGGHATDFSSCTYYAPPHERQVKMRLSGAEALPVPGGLLDVKQLQVETFDVTGKPGMIIRTPQCTYSPFNGVASSPGHLVLQTADGKMRTEGDGFLWQQADNSLTISNNVHTVVKAGIWKMTLP
jgi:hypothetical protein